MSDIYAPCRCQSGKKFKFCCLPVIKKGDLSEITSINSKFPIVDCKVLGTWEETGITPIHIIRQLTNESYIFISYLVDTWCLGLKDTSFKFEIDRQHLNLLLAAKDDLVSIAYQDARSIILGAIDFAKSIGIPPQLCWNKSASSFIEGQEPYNQKFSFGKDGAPFYVSGPYDHENYNVEEIMKKVNSASGHYVIAID